MIGTSLGPYQILAELGRGGMGVVYRARDTRLDRDVALKILPEVFADDPDRVARFEREAKALASISHPNIAGIYGVEQGAIVMEYVEGDDLSAHIARGRLTSNEALPITRQIVDALEAAHESGIIHRDLKPANVKVRSDGTVKVLDFGLAKALDPNVGLGFSPGSGPDAMNSPTLTARATQLGVILGTAAYMAPEQAKGRTVDKRADIWAFGVVLYEMLAGRRAFVGEDASETMAAVLTREPDPAALPNDTPAALRRLIGRCLVRDPRQRLRDIGDARFDLAEAERAPEATPSSSQPARVPRALVGALAVLAISTAGLATYLLMRPSAAPAAAPVQLSIALPAGHNLMSGPVISRDGRRVAWVSSDGIARPQLYVRDLDQPEARLLPGTEEATDPFFSPNGRAIAFYARNKLFRINVDGGAPEPLADSTSSNGGAWTDSGTIIFKRAWNGALHVIPEGGGKPEILTSLGKDEYAHSWPFAEPGSPHVLFASWGTSFNIVRYDTATRTRTDVTSGWRRFVVARDHVIAPADTDRELRAVALDPAATARSEVVTVLDGVDIGTFNGDARFDLSQTGSLVYVRAAPDQLRVVTVDRRGQSTHSALPERHYGGLRVSPSGHQAAAMSMGRLNIVNLDRGTVTPLTPELDRNRGARGSPVWHPDGKTITFSSNHEGNWEIYSKDVSGTGNIVPLLKLPMDQGPESYAPDGTLLFTTVGSESGADIWLRDPKGDLRALVATPAEEFGPRFSPDGRLVAYTSNASGRPEVYVQSRQNSADRVQVSAAGGEVPLWAPKGDRLFFRQGTAMMEAAISTSGTLTASKPLQLFNKGWTLQVHGADVMPSGDRFLMIEEPAGAIRNRIDVVLNWFARFDEKIRQR